MLTFTVPAGERPRREDPWDAVVDAALTVAALLLLLLA